MIWRTLCAPVLEYETPKVVVVRSKKIALLGRFIQACVLGYIIGYVLIYNKGYQEVSYIESDVIIKLKGISVTNFSDNQFHPEVPKDYRHLYNRVWDVTEYVIPPSENGAFFVTTNVVITPNQTLGLCDEDPGIVEAICENKTSCIPGKIFSLGNGAATGQCVNSIQKPGIKVCEVSAWCPVEVDLLPLKDSTAVISNAENYTVLIKNSISFPHFGEQYKRNNILRASNESYLHNCIYDDKNPFCPIFRLGDIVKSAGYDFSAMAVQGGVISIVIHWHCNLDLDFYEHCRPEYSFQRLDDPYTMISKGWNFRYTYHHEYNRRTLVKAYGIKFAIDVQGEASKFNLIPTMLNIGAGLALMSVTTILCDMILLYLWKNKRVFRSSKYEAFNTSDAFSSRRDDYENITDE